MTIFRVCGCAAWRIREASFRRRTTPGAFPCWCVLKCVRACVRHATGFFASSTAVPTPESSVSFLFVCLFVSNSETTCSRIALLACRSFIVIFGDILGVVLVRSLFCVEVRSVLNTTLVGILVRLSAALSGRRALIAGVDT